MKPITLRADEDLPVSKKTPSRVRKPWDQSAPVISHYLVVFGRETTKFKVGDCGDARIRDIAIRSEDRFTRVIGVARDASKSTGNIQRLPDHGVNQVDKNSKRHLNVVG